MIRNCYFFDGSSELKVFVYELIDQTLIETIGEHNNELQN